MRKFHILGLLLGSSFCIANAEPSTATAASTDQAPKVIMVKSAGNSSSQKPTHATTKTKVHKGAKKHKNTHGKALAKSSHKKTKSTGKQHKKTKPQ